MIPALAALAWGEPRRRAYWEQELLNALRHRRARLEHARGNARLLGRRHGSHPVDAGGVAQCRLDYDGDGRVNPFGKPDDALGRPRATSSSAASIARGEHWGYEVRGAAGSTSEGASRSYEAWQKAGVTRADGQPFPQPNASRETVGAGVRAARLPARPEFLCRALATTPR